ncbi:hypothetical protein DXG01_014959, partial [Tephrocybe rancida]
FMTKKTVLHMFAESGDLEMVKFLVEHGANLDVQDFMTKKTVLHMFAESGDLEMVKFLAEHGANLDVQ